MILLSLPGQSFPAVEVLWKPDKIAHLLLFGMQAVLLWTALKLPENKPMMRVSPMVFAGVATVIFGVLSEGYQAVFTTRTADVYDMIANAIGALTGLGIVLAVRPSRVLNLARKILRIPD
jgi:VanZ family protein